MQLTQVEKVGSELETKIMRMATMVHTICGMKESLSIYRYYR